MGKQRIGELFDKGVNQIKKYKKMVEAPIFQGVEGEDAEAYLRNFVRSNRMSGWPKDTWAQILSNFLEGVALAWHRTLLEAIKNDCRAVTIALRRRFGGEESPSVLIGSSRSV